MKRIIAILLSALCLISVISCSREEIIINETNTAEETVSEQIKESENNANNVDGVFAVGFAKTDVTPQVGVPLAGFANASMRLSKKILDKLYFTLILFQDPTGCRGAACTLDSLGLNNEFAQSLIKTISKHGNIKPENIVIGCTHTHSAPAIDADSNPSIANYMAKLTKSVMQATKDAIADLDESEIYIGSNKLDRMNFVRRYVDASGKFLGNNGNVKGMENVFHETEPDNEMQVIKFERKNSKDIAIVNWQAHPTMTGGMTKGDISADYISTFRSNAEKDCDIDFAFFEGAAGNLVVSSGIVGEGQYKSEDYKEYGKDLAKEFKNILDNNMTKVDSGNIKGETKILSCKSEKCTDPERIKTASEIVAKIPVDFDEATALAHANGFSSAYHASAVANSPKRNDYNELEATAFGFGDIAFIAAPYEMFCQNGMNVKNNSPFKMTFICEQANGKNGYLPSSDVFDNRGYEVDTTKYVKGTAEQFQNAFSEILNAAHS